MLFIKFVIFTLLIIYTILNVSGKDNDIEQLTNLFFSNLQNDPLLNKKPRTLELEQYADNQIGNYIDLVKRSRRNSNRRIVKRSLATPIDNLTQLTIDPFGTTEIDAISLQYTTTKSYVDTHIFRHYANKTSKLYLAGILTDTETYGNNLIVWRYNILSPFEPEEVYGPIKIINGTRLSLITLNNVTFIATAEYRRTSKNFEEKTAIFQFTPDDGLKIVQRVDVNYATDVVFWLSGNLLYLAFASEKTVSGVKVNYATESPIYVWLGKHFDLINTVKTYSPIRLTAFAVGSFSFLVVGNTKNIYGEKETYSDIYRQDISDEKYRLHQRLTTNDVIDVKYFCFSKTYERESFLIISNNLELDAPHTHRLNVVFYKYIDDYFIPFQGINIPGIIEWLPLLGSNGEFALLASTETVNLRVYGYDGWRFRELITYVLLKGIKGTISTMSYYPCSDIAEPELALISSDNSQVSIYNVRFLHKSPLTSYQDDLLIWCRRKLEEVYGYLETDDHTPMSKSQVKIENNDAIISSKARFNPERLDDVDSAQEDELAMLQERLNAVMRRIKTLKSQADTLRNSSLSHTIYGDVTLKSLVLNKASELSTVKSETLNDIDLQHLLENIILLNQDVNLEDPIKFEEVVINNLHGLNSVNGISPESIIRKHDDISLQDLEIEGQAIFNDKLKVAGRLEGIKFTNDAVLLTSGSQVLKTDLSAKNLNINNLFGINSDFLSTTSEKITNDIKAKNITVSGLINNVNISLISESILKTHGDQEINAEYIFDYVKINDLNTGTLAGKQVPNDLIFVGGSKQEVNQDVQFENDVIMNNVLVEKRLNNIKVNDGKLDVLLKSSTSAQYIDGYKLIENVELIDRIKYRGKIDKKIQELFGPVTSYDGLITIIGNRTIDGTVTIENQMIANDLNSINQNYSIKRLERDGLKITENIPIHLKFLQQQRIDEVFVEKVNDFDAHSWIHNHENEKQIVKGKKIFLNNLHVTRTLQIRNVNHINLNELNENTLKVNEDQIINGKHHVRDVLAERIQANNTYLRGKQFGNIITEDVGIFDNIQAKVITASNAIFTEFNGVNVTHLLEDTVYKDNNVKISGHKTFSNLTIYEANVTRGMNMTRLLGQIRGTINLHNNVNLPPNVIIKNLKILHFINDIPTDKITTKNMCQDIVIDGEQKIEKLISFKNVFIKGNKLNGLDVTEIEENTLKADEPFEFDTVHLENIVSHSPIKINGRIDNIDLENIVTNTKEDLLILNKKIFNNNVSVDGYLMFNDLVNGVNISKLCSCTLPPNNDFVLQLVINGNASFGKGLKVKYINDQILNTILEEAWFTNKDTTLHGHLEFDHIRFENLDLKGLLNNVDLLKFNDTYFSKSRNQTITAILEFTDGVLFKEVVGKEVTLESMYGINLEDFIRNAILNDVDQIFESSLLLDNVSISDLQGQYMLNGLDVINDFMRYSSENNFVTGLKVLNNLNVKTLQVDRKYKVKDVDLLTWIYRAIQNNGNIVIEFPVLFNNVTHFKKQLGLPGLLNGLPFTKETILLKSSAQNVIGKKRFSNQIVFNSIILHGLLNGINMDNLLENKMNKKSDIKFEMPINLKNQLTMNNLDIKNLFNDVNITEMVRNINNLATINNYAENYANLFHVATKIRSSLTHQAFFINYYKEIQIFTNHKLMLHIKVNGIQRIAGLRNGTDTSEVNFYRWNPDLYQFVIDSSLPQIKFYRNVIDMKSIKSFDGNSYLYVESYYGKDNIYVGNIIYLNNENSIVEKFTYQGFKTRFLMGVILPDKYDNCLLAIYYHNEFAHIYCEQRDGDSLVLKQRLSTRSARMATTININGSLYVIITNAARDVKESCVDIWRFELNEQKFILYDVIHVVGPRSISSISHKGNNYLVIASGFVKNTMYSGMIDIRRFNEKSKKFITWHTLKIRAPVEVKFSLLPSNELLLYVLTKDPIEPLKTYIYDGIFGFKENLRAMKTMKITDIEPFNAEANKHFVIAHNKDLMVSTILEGIFKGHNYDV